jgi:hypothetical protein
MDWIKVAGVTVLLAVFSADLCTRIASAFGSQSPDPVGVLLAKLNDSSSAIQAGTAVASAIFALFLLLVNRGQLKAAKDNAAAARSAAEATATQARIAEQTISRLERPHLFPICEHNFLAVLGPLQRHWSMYNHLSSGWPAMDTAPKVSFRFRKQAQTLAGLKFKLRAVSWCNQGKLSAADLADDPQPASDMRLLAGLLADLSAMGGAVA